MPVSGRMRLDDSLSREVIKAVMDSMGSGGCANRAAATGCRVQGGSAGTKGNKYLRVAFHEN